MFFRFWYMTSVSYSHSPWLLARQTDKSFIWPNGASHTCTQWHSVKLNKGVLIPGPSFHFKTCWLCLLFISGQTEGHLSWRSQHHTTHTHTTHTHTHTHTATQHTPHTPHTHTHTHPHTHNTHTHNTHTQTSVSALSVGLLIMQLHYRKGQRVLRNNA